MHREHVELVRTYQAIDDSIGPVDHLPDLGNAELGDDATRLREPGESIRGCNDPSYDDRCEIGRVLRDEGLDCCQIAASAARPGDPSHEANCFLISSWGISSPASD